MNFDPVKTQDDPGSQERLLIYRNIEKQITQFAIYGKHTAGECSNPIQDLILQHYKVCDVGDLKPKDIREIWTFAKGLNEVGGLWMVFHGYRRFIQSWIDLTRDHANVVNLNEFWINSNELILQTDR
tara:strand:+ start:194 stop:574 length:381 start_codon:yes stop_codon:yes gene_type:complete